MAEYIDREQLLEHLQYLNNELPLVSEHDWGRALGYDEVIDEVKKYPSEDVQPVKHGKWINGLEVPEYERRKHPYVYLNGDTYCSECFAEAYWDTDYGQQLFKYCPNCGAKMDGEI